jgi:LruC domain-containing protein
MLLVLLAGCPIPFASFDSGGNGAGSGDTALSADQINDSLRSLAGDFTFETLLPVQVRLDIELYDTDAEGNILPEPLPPGSADIHVSLTDTRGELLYSGKASADGTLAAAVYLPSAPEDVTLALQAAGFEGRSVEIRRMVAYREINRTMAMKRLPPDQRSAARSAEGFVSPYPDSVINVPIITVAYEDLYGRTLAGDADYNDFIASYSISETLDDEGRVISIQVEAEAVRKWAGYDHRFGIRIDTYEGDASVSGTYINGSGTPVPFSGQNLQAPREIVLFERSSRAVGETAAFTITFDTPQIIDPAEAVLSRPPYNPYIYVHNTTRDIHLIDREPLSFSTNPDPADRFVDDDGYPWALLVPSVWESPAEAQRIEEAYPRFDNWRISGGSEHGDWYEPLNENSAPYPVIVPFSSKHYDEDTGLQFFQLQIDEQNGLEDPDGDVVYFRSSSLPSWISLDEDTGLVTVDTADTHSAEDFLFWSEDENGAETRNNAVTITISVSFS